MNLAGGTLGEGKWQARLCDALGKRTGAGAWKRLCAMTAGATPVSSDRGFLSAIAGSKLRMERPITAFTSSGASICRRRDRSIRKNIIGHGMSAFPERFSRGNLFVRLLRAFPLLHQPARQQGRRTFFDPQVEQGANFLAEIGGMVEPREFETLQRVVRSREKRLPRGLSFATVHAGLLVAGARMLTLRYSWSIVPMV